MDFTFQQFEKKEEQKPEIKSSIEVRKQEIRQDGQVEKKEIKKTINFQELPQNTEQLLSREDIEKFSKEEQIGLPYDDRQNTNSYLSLVLSPDLRDLEMMIRGLEFVRRYNPLSKKEEVILRKIPEHPLNEYGINKIMSELKVYCSPEIKLGRKNVKAYYLSINHVCHSIVRLIYKNLKSFGMDTQEKQRSAKSFCNAIIEFVDSSYSRSIEGKENDLSRATEFKIEGNIDTLNDPAKLFSKQQKEQMKN